MIPENTSAFTNTAGVAWNRITISENVWKLITGKLTNREFLVGDVQGARPNW